MRDPFVLLDLEGAHGQLSAYDTGDLAAQAVAEILYAEQPARGRLPVDLEGLHAFGSGLVLSPAKGLHSLAQRLESWDRVEAAGFAPAALDQARQTLLSVIERGDTPGAAMIVGRRGRIVAEWYEGTLSYEDLTPVSEDTLYDLASLTKVIATTTLTMRAHEAGRIGLDSPMGFYLPEFLEGAASEPERSWRQAVQVADVLRHESGLLWWTDLWARHAARGKRPGLPPDGSGAWQAYLDEIFGLPLESQPGTEMAYSDLGFLLMGEILQRSYGLALEQLVEQELKQPLGLEQLCYRPAAEELARIAPTEVDSTWRGGLVHGEVHDENAAGLGGIAPHAGLFSNARDVASFAQMLLNGGSWDGVRYLSGATLREFTTRSGRAEGSSRALGWDTPSGKSSAGQFFSARSFGHTGFTGTSLWIDPELDLYVVLLTNRVHPTRENKELPRARGVLHDAVVRAITDTEVRPRGPLESH